MELIREYRHDRQRRSITSERNVEALVVADKSMYDFHKDDVENYVLTIMNMVRVLTSCCMRRCPKIIGGLYLVG